MRDMERDEFSSSLQHAGAAAGKEESQTRTPALKIEDEHLPADPGLFLGKSSATAIGTVSAAPIGLHAALPKRLGSLAFWRSGKNFIDEMEKIYKNASGHISS
jgi:uncharacterized Zn finger protein